VSTAAPSYKRHRFPVDIIQRCVWLHFRFSVSFRDVEEMMLERGVVVSYETIRRWCAKFGQDWASQLRHRRPRPGDKWHLDKVFMRGDGEQRYLWRRSTSTATCSTCWCSPAAMPRLPSDSFVSCSRACDTCRGCWSPTSQAGQLHRRASRPARLRRASTLQVPEQSSRELASVDPAAGAGDEAFQINAARAAISVGVLVDLTTLPATPTPIVGG